MVIIAEDLNAHLGRRNDEDKCLYFYTRTNSNGSYIRDTAMETGMEITNLRFQKRKENYGHFCLMQHTLRLSLTLSW